MRRWTTAGAVLAAMLMFAPATEGACSKKQDLSLTLASNGQGMEVGLGCYLQPLSTGQSKDLCAQATGNGQKHTFTFEIKNECAPKNGGDTIEVQAYLVIDKGALGFESKECGDGSYQVSLPLGPIQKAPVRQACVSRVYQYLEPVQGQEPRLRATDYHIYFTRVTERDSQGKIHKDYLLPMPLEFDPQIAVERAGDETLPPLRPKRNRP